MIKELVEQAEYSLRNTLRMRGIELARVAQFPRAESLLALHLDKLFRALGVDLVLDVGARVGDYAVWLRRNGYRGRIISFEPVSSSYAELQRRAAGDELWDTMKIALGSEDSEAEINVTRQTYFSSFLVPNEYSRREFEKGPEIDHVERVDIRRLDGVLPTMFGRVEPSRIYLKMDTQGWDLEVLRGSSGILGKIAALQSEVSVMPIYSGMPNFCESIERITEMGFALSGLFPVNLDSSHRVVEFDCVCVASERSEHDDRERAITASEGD